MLLATRTRLQDLLGRFIRDRDAVAMEEFVRRTRPHLLAVARRIGAAQDAEDSVQAAYHALLARGEQLLDVHPLAWLTTTVVRIAYRRKAVAKRQSQLAEQLARSHEDSGPYREVVRAEESGMLRDQISRLPAKYRDAVVLHHLEGLTVVETARLLECPAATVKTRLRRARALLRGRLSRAFVHALFVVPWILTDAARAGTAPLVGMGGGIVNAKAAVVTVAVALTAGVGGYAVGTQTGGSGQTARAARSGQQGAATPAAAKVAAQIAPFEDLVKSVPTPVVRTGNGEIRGQVLTKSGEPVAGAVIVARPNWSPPGAEQWWDPNATMEESLLGFIASRKWQDAVLKSAEADASGAYLLVGLARGKYNLAASCQGYAIRHENRRQHSGVAAGATVDFVAEPRVEVEIDVRMPDGSRASGAQVSYKQAEHRGGAINLHWSPRRPRLQFPEGTLELYATAGDAQEYRSRPKTVILKRGMPPPRLVFDLEGRPGLRGRVLLPEDLKPRWVYVYVRSFGGTEVPQKPIEVRDMKYAQAAADEGYAYVLQDLEPGRYLVGLSVDRRVLETAELVEVPDYLLQRDLTLPPPDPKRHRAVRVLGQSGSPLEVVSFSSSYKTERFSGGGPCTMFARKDGSYLIRTMDWASKGAGEGGTHTLSIRTRDGGTIREPFDPAAPGELVIRVAAQATLHVTLEGYVGSGHEGKVRLALRRASEKDHQRASGRDQPDSKGQQTLGPVQSGEAVLLIGVDQRGLFWIADRIPVSLRPGENRVSVPVPALHDLTVSGKAGDRFRISPANEDRDLLIGYWEIQKDGEVIVEQLPAGTYEVSGNQDGKKWMRKVTLPGQSTLRLP